MSPYSSVGIRRTVTCVSASAFSPDPQNTSMSCAASASAFAPAMSPVWRFFTAPRTASSGYCFTPVTDIFPTL